ncbi:hypothetical protein AHF37_11127 [Paragonimus kellicotti]|nr:hypothetical protein AHF37_11127 [Paragonimus kellicotti]
MVVRRSVVLARLLRSSVISPNISARRLIGSLVVIEHSDGKCEPVNLNAISAAKKFGEVCCLVAGFKCGKISEEMASVAGVTRVLVADDVVYEVRKLFQLLPFIAWEIHFRIHCVFLRDDTSFSAPH